MEPTAEQTVPPSQPSNIRISNVSSNPVLVAAERAFRPDQFKKGKEPAICPFCPGNEDHTPKPELYRFPYSEQPWQIRVVPNMFPVLRTERQSKFLVDGHLAATITTAHGAHEVIIETPGHDDDFSTMPPQQLKILFEAIVNRTEDLYGDQGIKFIVVFKNHGPEAGASLKHPHTQLIGLPLIPPKILQRLHRLEIYHTDHGRSIFEIMLEHSASDNRIVISSANFACFVPYEAKFPFEMCITPLTDQSNFTEAQNNFEELTKVVSEAFRRLAKVLNGLPPFNLVLDEAPPKKYRDCSPFYRWRLRIFPRLTMMGGFELAASFFVNPLPPEQAAQLLKEAQI